MGRVPRADPVLAVGRAGAGGAGRGPGSARRPGRVALGTRPNRRSCAPPESVISVAPNRSVLGDDMEMRAMSAFDDDRPPTSTGSDACGGGGDRPAHRAAGRDPARAAAVHRTDGRVRPAPSAPAASCPRLGLVVAILGGPPWLVWRLVTAAGAAGPRSRRTRPPRRDPAGRDRGRRGQVSESVRTPAARTTTASASIGARPRSPARSGSRAPQRVEHGVGLGALGDHVEAEAVPELDHRGHDRVIARVASMPATKPRSILSSARGRVPSRRATRTPGRSHRPPGGRPSRPARRRRRSPRRALDHQRLSQLDLEAGARV